MEDYEDWILLESNGPILKYLCPKDNTIIECIADFVIPQIKVDKYQGTVIWSQDTPIALQVMGMKKICADSFKISDQEFLRMAREERKWAFGEFFVNEAMDILKTAQKYGLNVEMVNIDSGEKLVI